MKTNIESIYKNMKPSELAGIAFTAIGKHDTNTWRACEANVGNKTYVGRDLDYTRTLQSHIDFSIMAGLQYHKQAFAFYGLLQQRRHDEIDMKDAGIKQEHIDTQMHELADLISDAGNKFQLILNLINSLCDQYSIDKHTCLAFAEINMTVEELEATAIIDLGTSSDAVRAYYDNYKYAFEATINPQMRGTHETN